MDLITAIDNYQKDKTRIIQLENKLFEEILEAVKGQKTSKFLNFVYYLLYDKSVPYHERNNNIPSYICDSKYKVPNNKGHILLEDINFTPERGRCFSEEIFNLLINKFVSMIDQKDIAIWTKEKEYRIKYIRGQLGQIIHNKIFENNKKQKPDVSFISDEDRKVNEDGTPYESGFLEAELARDYFHSSNSVSSLTDDYFQIVSKQKEAFFWKPGMLFQDQTIDSKNAIYLAFFYMWLRLMSNASKTEVTEELGVSRSKTKGWLPHPKLQEPFDHIDFPFFNVFFSKQAIETMGLHEKHIRCFKGSCEKEKYKPIEKTKNNLWDVYDFLRNFSLIDFIEESPYDNSDATVIDEMKLPFTYAVTSCKSSSSQETSREAYIHIKTMEVSS